MAGPTTAPRLVTAVSQPRALVRWSGSLASATYADTTPIVPAPTPWITREMRSSGTDRAKAKTTYATAVVARPKRMAGRRP